MATILLLHSIRGLRDLERDAAARLGALGHRVATPDLYAGHVAASVEEGVAISERIGPEAVFERASECARDLPADAVLAGFSWGAFVACQLLATRPEAAGLLLLHGLGPLPEGFREGLPAQWHMAEPDPFDDEEFLAGWEAEARASGLALETFRYKGAGHLFTDPALPDHDPEAASLLWRRATAFLAAL